MFKKIITFIFISYIFGICTSNAANYTNHADSSHQGFVAPLITATNNFIASNGGTITSSDLPALQQIVGNVIANAGGWDGTTNGVDFSTLATLEGGVLTVGCGNEPIISLCVSNCGGGGTTDPIPEPEPTCPHCSWSCSWTDCSINNPIRTDCKNSCTQNYVCTNTCVPGPCEGDDGGADPSYSVTKTGSLIGCTQAPSCGDAEGEYSYNDTDWPVGSKFCTIGTGSIDSTGTFPGTGGTTNWTCTVGTESVPCTATRGIIYPLPYCGDGIVQKPNFFLAYETCDDGNKNNTDLCKNDCTGGGNITKCGDSIIQSGETCDDGNNNDTDLCKNDCTGGGDSIICGDGVVQSGEECDDGNYINFDTCQNNCAIPGNGDNFCGDGFTQGGEACDDGNYINNDGCQNNCTIPGTPSIPYCGDGFTQGGEACDDGNYINNDSCRNNCTIPGTPSIPYCGDGFIIDLVEACDDGNNLSLDGCSSTCTIESFTAGGYCGDGTRQSPETCDDGNNINNDGCSSTCTVEGFIEGGYCGDGIHQEANSFGIKEECDDGNTDNSDLDKPSDQRCSNNCTRPNTSLPGEIGLSASTTCELQNDDYANYSDENIVYTEMNVQDGPNGQDVLSLGTPTNFVDLSNNLTDRVNNVGPSSLTFTPLEINWDPSKGETQLVPIAKVKSVTPFRSCNNKLSFELGGKTIIVNDVGYHFKKPFIGKLTITEGTPSLGTKLNYRLTALPNTGIVGYDLGLKINNISYLGQNITLQSTYIKNTGISGPIDFETRINSSIYATELNNNPGLQVILPTISYTLNNQLVRYYLSEGEYGDDKTPIRLQGEVFIGIKILGGLQGDGKYEFTGQGKNISNLYPSDLRSEVRKRAYDYIKGMTSGQAPLNKVYFVEGNATISGDLPYETLVVKNGNVIIESNLNPSNKKLGIIVLKDNYDTNNGYNHEGNVFVNKSVTNINAMIYADGGFISSNDSGIPYIQDSAQRTNELQNQLFMNGLLFTRNTIGGAQYGGIDNGGTYILPGGSKTLSFDKAMIYDLNYIRRGNVGCIDKNANLDCEDSTLGEIKEGFIIKYDTRIQSDPPKLFSK